MNNPVTCRPVPYLERWRFFSLRPSLALWIGLPCLATLGFGQATDSAEADKKVEDEPIVMDVFTVNTSSDMGYLAQNSLSGSRMNSNLKDLATPTTVFTEEFMRDVAINNTDELATYMVSTQYYTNTESPGQNEVNNDARALKVRGLPGGTRSVNFFATELRFDKFSLDRIEQSRGPNAILFGIGSPGGIINVTTKRANLTRQGTEITISARSYNGLREEIEFNQPLIEDRLAIRISAVEDDVESWRNYEYDNQDRFFGTLKLKVASRTELNVEAESGHIEMARKRSYIAHDGFTPWLRANKTLGLTGYDRFYDRQSNPLGGQAFAPLVTDPAALDEHNNRPQLALNSGGTAAIKAYFLNHGIRYQAQPGGTGAGSPNTPYVVYNTESDILYNMASQLAAARGLSDENLTLSLQPGPLQPYGSDFSDPDLGYLDSATSIYGPGNYQATDYDRLTAFLNHSFNEHFSAELAAFRLTTHRLIFDPSQDLQLNVDVDASIPDLDGVMDADNSAVIDANPNVGRPYFEAYPEIDTRDQDDKALRLSLAYDYDLGFLGHHRLAGVYQYYTRDFNRLVLREQIVTNPYNTSSIQNTQNRVWRRTYVGQPVGDLNDHNWTLDGVDSRLIVMDDWQLANFQGQPVRGNTASQSSITTAWLPFGNENTSTSNSGPDKLSGDSTIIALQSDFWQRRVFTVLGYSLEHQTHHEGLYTTIVHPDYPGFTGGYITPYLDPVPDELEGDNKSAGAVFHATPWLSFTFNTGTSQTIPDADGRLPDMAGEQSRAPVASGETQDIGFKLDLFDHRVFFTATYFDTSVENDAETFGITQTAYNPIWTAITDLHPGYVVRERISDGKILTPADSEYSNTALSNVYTGAKNVQTNTTVFDAEATGIELELTANLTDHWRLIANYNYTNLRRSSIGTEMIAYIEKWRTTWAQFSTDSLPVGALADTIGEQLGIIDNQVITVFYAPDGEQPVGSNPSKGNLRTAYDFSKGWLKGVSINGGVRYESPSVLAYAINTAKGSDGFYHPIDADGDQIGYEPGVGYANVQNKLTGRRTIMGEEQYFFDASIGYKRKVTILGNKKAVWSLQLNVNNVLNNDDMVVTRVSAFGSNQPIGYRLNTPREWILTSRLKF